jgi:hypothetical protein
MSIFGSIVSAIVGTAKAAEASPTSAEAPAATKPAAGQATTATAAPGSTATPKPAAGSTPAGATPLSHIDVETVLTKLAAQNREKLDWRRSIVDLMKLLDLDSSLSARKQLAKELNYSGNTDDSASMNIWLHKQVMTKLAASGGKVPDEMKS